VHLAAMEKMKKGSTEPIDERYMLGMPGITRLKQGACPLKTKPAHLRPGLFIAAIHHWAKRFHRSSGLFASLTVTLFTVWV